jgi:hypothetical protein
MPTQWRGQALPGYTFHYTLSKKPTTTSRTCADDRAARMRARTVCGPNLLAIVNEATGEVTYGTVPAKGGSAGRATAHAYTAKHTCKLTTDTWEAARAAGDKASQRKWDALKTHEYDTATGLALCDTSGWGAGDDNKGWWKPLGPGLVTCGYCIDRR